MFTRRRDLAAQPRAPRSCGPRAAALACGSAAPCDANFGKSHLLTLHRRSGLLLQYRLLPLRAANPGRSSKAEAESRLQHAPSAPFAGPWRAPPEQSPAPGPARLATRLSADSASARCFFWFSSPWLRQGQSSSGSGSLLSQSRHTLLTHLSRGKPCSANTSPHSHPSPPSIRSQNAFVLLHEDSYFFLLQSTESLAEQPTAPGTLGLAIKNP